MSSTRYTAARFNHQRSPRDRSRPTTWVDGIRGIAYCFAAFFVVGGTLRVASRVSHAAMRYLRR